MRITPEGDDSYLKSMHSKNPKAFGNFSFNIPGQTGTHLQLSELRP